MLPRNSNQSKAANKKMNLITFLTELTQVLLENRKESQVIFKLTNLMILFSQAKQENNLFRELKTMGRFKTEIIFECLQYKTTLKI